MSVNSKAPTIIVKKVKKGGGDGHHGGAWKVAYADFVTAMMAFFMLMWLLNATTEKQRKGIADYFSPTIPINKVSGGGDGSFGGENIFTEEVLVQNGVGASNSQVNTQEKALVPGDDDGERRKLEELEQALTARAGESMFADELLQHIVTKVTDEGLIVELFDIPGEPLFLEEGMSPIMTEILRVIAGLFAPFENRVAVNGHVKAYPIVFAQDPTWDLSHERANVTREQLIDEGLAGRRFERVSGFADSKPVTFDPMSVRNNRVEVILLRAGR